MNYRHGFHAGNFADVLKHLVLGELLRLLTAKDKKLFVLDTHAGTGGYDLSGDLAGRTREADGGILRLWDAPKPGRPEPVSRYLAAVAAFDRKFGGGRQRPVHYPGSPRLIRAGLRPGDRFVACELHPQDVLALKREFAGDRSIEVREEDGYHAVHALLPPIERRGLILIDPPFEASDEFERLQRALKHGLRRFATGCYAIWYPIKNEAAAESFVAGLSGLKCLHLEIQAPPAAPGKLAACGMTVINPPWKFDEAMRQSLPWIANALGGQVAISAPAAAA